jgi:predicted outer membrane repeat protein
MSVLPPATHAGTITVTNTNNSGSGSLRQAIMDANAAAGADTITFSVTGTIKLSSALPAISGDLTITGPGASSLTISGENVGRVFFISSGANVTISGVTVANGRVTSTDVGGGIRNEGTLTLTDCILSSNTSSGGNGGGLANSAGKTANVTNCTFSGNTAYYSGGGIANEGTLVVTNSTFSNNHATQSYGGGLYNHGTATVNNSSFSGNTASDGGGMQNRFARATVTGSAFTGNTASSYGGGITNTGDSNTTLTVANSTVANNTTTQRGSGIHNYYATATVVNTTIAGNNTTNSGTDFNTGAGLYTYNGTATIKNTISGNNTTASANSDCYGTFDATSTTNLATDNTCGSSFTQVTSVQLALGTLTGNPAYLPLNAGSAAIDTGNDGVCAAAPVNNLDQRGVIRPQGAHCDIGAYEYSGFVPTNFLYLPLILR